MRRRELQPLLLVLAVLVILFVGAEALRRLRTGEPRSVAIFSEFDPSLVETITIARGTTRLYLTREGSTWSVLSDTISYRADPDMVQRLITSLEDLNGTVVSENPDNHSVFDVDSTKGIEVSVLGPKDQILADLVIGKVAPSMAGTYFRRGHEPEVYLADGFLRSIYSNTLRTWRNRKILAFEPSELRAIELGSAPELIRLERSDSTLPWRMTRPEEAPANTAAVDEIARVLSHLTGSDFAPDTLGREGAGLAPPQYRLQVELASGETKEVTAGGDPEAVRLNVQVTGDETIYVVPKVTIEMAMKTIEELKARSEVPAGESAPADHP
jgi:hypothetical protein